VSGYDAAKLGENGVLGLLGTDGVFRVRRTGDIVWAGDIARYTAMVPAQAESAGPATLSNNEWDDVPRYTSVRQIYGFPLAVVVGLSADEQLKEARGDHPTYLWRASAGSLVVVLILALFGALPTWGHSRSWGYGPSGGLGLVLLILIVLVLTGRM